MIGYILVYTNTDKKIAYLFVQNRQFYPVIIEKNGLNHIQTLQENCIIHHNKKINKEQIILLNSTNKELYVYAIILDNIKREELSKQQWMPYFYQLEKFSNSPFVLKPEKKKKTKEIIITSSMLYNLVIEK